MSLLRVLDQTGHRELRWDTAALAAGDAEARAAVAEAECIFAEARARGSTAFRVDGSQEQQGGGGRAFSGQRQILTRIERFDPQAEQILLVPRIIGG
jgi:hypothetical protein